MSEHKLGKEILKYDQSGIAPNPAAEILRKDRRMMRLMVGCTIFFWILAGGGITIFYSFWVVFVAPKVNYLLAHPTNTQQYLHAWNQVFYVLLQIMHPMIVGAIIAFFLAAAATVALIYVSRRATLRQVNAALADISLQLRQMQRG